MGRRAAFALLVLGVLALPGSAAGGESKQLKSYWTDDAVTAERSPTTEGGWSTGLMPTTFAPGDTLWVGFNNLPDTLRTKNFTIHFDMERYEDIQMSASAYYDSNVATPVVKKSMWSDAAAQTRTWEFSPQPRWERFMLTRRPTNALFDQNQFDWDIQAFSLCYDSLILDDLVRMIQGTIGARGAMKGEPRIKRLYVFPERGVVPSGPHHLPPPTPGGPWLSQIVNVDPDGNFHPGGGVEFTTTGAGLSVDDRFSMTVTLGAGTGSRFHLYAWDEEENFYSHFVLSGTPALGPHDARWFVALAVGLAMLAVAWLARRRLTA